MINKRDFPYRVVPNHWRGKVFTKPTRNLQPIDDPIILEILKGNTVLIEADIPLSTKNIGPYRNLYATLATRGYRLKMHLYDEIDKDIYRAILMWAEPLVVLWNCSRCGNFEVSSYDTKPQTQGCEEAKFHSWRRINNMHKKRVREELAA